MVDASALVKLLAAEPGSEAWRAWWRDQLSAGVQAFAPPLLRYEVGSHLARHETDVPPPERARLLAAALMGVTFLDGEAAPFAPPLSYYDASYVGLARAFGASLVTYDADCLRSARRAGIAVQQP